MTLLLAALLSFAAVPASSAECYVTWDCNHVSGCVSIYGANTGRNGPFPSCDPYQKTDNVGHCSCGGGAAPSAPSSYRAPSGGGLTQQQQLGMQMGMLGAQMIGAGLRGLMNRPPAQETPGPAPYQAARSGPVGVAPAAPVNGCDAQWGACADALADQSEALSAERVEAADFPMAIVKGHADYGLDQAKDYLGDRLSGADEIKEDPMAVYHEQFPEKKPETFEEAAGLIGYVGDQNAKWKDYNPSKSLLAYGGGEAAGWAKSEGANKLAGRVEKQRDSPGFWEKWRQTYHDDIKKCAHIGEADALDACLLATAKHYEQLANELLKKFPGYDQAKARVDQAKDALSKYAQSALNKAEGLMTKTSRCPAPCR